MVKNISESAASSSKSSCPYGVVLDEDEQSHGSSGGELWQQAKRNCPAFEDGSCPFSKTNSPEAIRKTLVQMPSSHYQDHSFTKSLQYLHSIVPNVSKTEYQLTECPVQPYLSLRQPMEESSIATLMARMIRDTMEEEGEINDDNLMEDFSEGSSSSNKELDQSTRSNLSNAFKTGTSTSHEEAENVHFVKNFVRGKIDRNLYADLVVALYHVYVALEEELDKHAPQHFASVHFPHELNRVKALEEDVDFWHGHTIPPISEATRDYVQRIHSLAKTDPLLLLAHAYTRYLGDLSGGKVLARVARRAMQLDDGLAFFHFDHIESPKRFKDKYRACLDELELSADQVTRLVAEANIAFLLNMRIFEELDVKANIPGATVRTLQGVLEMPLKENPNASSGECPFMQNKSNDTAKSRGRSGECPFVQTQKQQQVKKCPWPFILLHDPATGLADFKTRVVVGLLLALAWSHFVNMQ